MRLPEFTNLGATQIPDSVTLAWRTSNFLTDDFLVTGCKTSIRLISIKNS